MLVVVKILELLKISDERKNPRTISPLQTHKLVVLTPGVRDPLSPTAEQADVQTAVDSKTVVTSLSSNTQPGSRSPPIKIFGI